MKEKQIQALETLGAVDRVLHRREQESGCPLAWLCGRVQPGALLLLTPLPSQLTAKVTLAAPQHALLVQR